MVIIDNIQVEYPISQTNDGTVVVTSPDIDYSEKRAYEVLRSAMESFSDKSLSSVIPNDSTSSQEITLEWIDQVSLGLNSSKDNIITVNSVVLRKLVSDAFLGLVYSLIVANINSRYRMTYNEKGLSDENAEELAKVKEEIEYFNNSVEIEQVITESIAKMFSEGNCPLTLRYTKNNAPLIESYPISLCEVSDYKSGKFNVMQFSISELRSRLQKTYRRTKKNKALFYQGLKDEIKANDY